MSPPLGNPDFLLWLIQLKDKMEAGASYEEVLKEVNFAIDRIIVDTAKRKQLTEDLLRALR